MNINKIEKELYNLMQEARKNNEVPISALIIRGNEIISKNYNKVNSTNNILDHAEVLVINEASKKLNNWRLNDCELYVSLEPCNMCKEIIKRSRLKKVVYFSQQNNQEINKEVIYNFKSNDDISNYLKSFFKSKR